MSSPDDVPKRDRREWREWQLKLESPAIVSLLLLIVDLVVLVMTVGGAHGPVRLVLGLILGCFVPGWSIVGLLKIANPWLELSLTVAVSLALLMVVAQILITTNTWHPVVLEEVTCAVCLPSLIWQSLGRSRVRGRVS